MTSNENDEDETPPQRYVTFQDSDSRETLCVTAVGEDLYRLEDTPICSCFAVWGDVVRVREDPTGHLVVLLAQHRELPSETPDLLLRGLDADRSCHGPARHELVFPGPQLLGSQLQLPSDLADRPTQLRDLPDRFVFELRRKGPSCLSHGTRPCLEYRGKCGVHQIEATSMSDAAQEFPTSSTVNRALGAILEVAPKRAPRREGTKQKV